MNHLRGESSFMTKNPHLITDFLRERGVRFDLSKGEEGELVLIFGVVAKPGGRQSKMMVTNEGDLAIQVTARAVDGAANKAIIKLLARGLGVAASRVELVSGQRGKQKRIAIHYIFSDHKNENFFLKKIKESLL